MKKLGFAAALALTMVVGSVQPAMAWDCTQLTSGGGGTWYCETTSGEAYYVDCSAGSGNCVYHRF